MCSDEQARPSPTPAHSWVQTAWIAGLAPAARRFRADCAAPQRAQDRRLRAILREVAASDYGRAHRLHEVDTYADFARRVPIVDYDALSPWINRIAAGEHDVLSLGRVRALEPTGGSSGVRKWIPFTQSFVDEIARSTSAWLADLHHAVPGLRGTRSYWAISPAVRREKCTSGGVRLGLDSDAEYFGPLARWALKYLWAVPQDVDASPSIDAWRERTCLALLRADNLGLISVWSPTFLTLLFEHMERHLEGYLARLGPQRANAVRRGLDAAGTFCAKALWPGLSLVSLWMSASAKLSLPALDHYLAGVQLQPKGLIATEGIVSFPLWGEEGAVLAVGSHFLELMDLDGSAGTVRRAHEVRPGACYSPVVTTSNGLLRYHLKDVVRCVGYTGATPRVVFEGRLDRTSDLAGEKLTEGVVREALASATSTVGVAPRFVLLAPELSPARYVLFVEGELTAQQERALAVLAESALRRAHHYDYCRTLGQLAPMEVVRVHHGHDAYVRELLRRGRKLGDIKPEVLDTSTGWRHVLLGDR